MGEYHRGEMDIQEHAATYEIFLGMTKWGSLAVAAIVLALTLWFCTPAGFFGGVIPALALVAVGVFVLRDKPAAEAGH